MAADFRLVQLELATHLVVLKQGNAGLYNAIGQALQAISDPEMRRFLAAPRETLQLHQGRSQMMTEMLEAYYRCEQTVADFQKAQQPIEHRTPPAKGAAFNG